MIEIGYATVSSARTKSQETAYILKIDEGVANAGFGEHVAGEERAKSHTCNYWRNLPANPLVNWNSCVVDILTNAEIHKIVLSEACFVDYGFQHCLQQPCEQQSAI